jgi:transposase InsO family protein
MRSLRQPTGSPVADEDRVYDSASAHLRSRLAEITLGEHQETHNMDVMEGRAPMEIDAGAAVNTSAEGRVLMEITDSGELAANTNIIGATTLQNNAQEAAVTQQLLEMQKKLVDKYDLRIQHLERMLHSVQRRELEAIARPLEDRSAVRATDRYVDALINKIPKFAGVVNEGYLHNLQAFNNACRAFISGASLSQAQKMTVITGQFEDLALSWWQDIVMKQFDSDAAAACKALTVGDFMSRFLEHFTPPNVEIEICEALQNMRQGKEQITTFISRFRSMAGLSRVMHESTKAFFFLNALSPHLAQMVKVQCENHCNFDQLCTVANRVRKSSGPSNLVSPEARNNASTALFVGGASNQTGSAARQVQCHACKGFGHIRRDCPNVTGQGIAPAMQRAMPLAGKVNASNALQRMAKKQSGAKNFPLVCYAGKANSLNSESESDILDFVIDSGAGRHLIAEENRSLKSTLKAARADNCELSSDNKFEKFSKGNTMNDLLVKKSVKRQQENIIDDDQLHKSVPLKRARQNTFDDTNQEHVILADGKVVQAKNVGNLTADLLGKLPGQSSEIVLADTLAVPELKFNLFSVPAANKEGTDVHFWRDGSVTMNHGHEEIIRTDPTDGNLRVLKLRLFRNSVRDFTDFNTGYSSAFAVKVPDVSFMLLHESLGHPSLGKMRKMSSAGILGDCKVVIPNLLHCDVCQQSKQTRRVKGSGGTKYKLLEVIHSDICEMSEKSLGGARYMLTFVDDCSRFCYIYFLPNKDAETVVSKFDEFVNWAERTTNCKVLRLRSDHGSEYENAVMKAFCCQRGIVQEFANSYSPSQNGTAERINRSLLEIMRANMIQARLPGNLWAEVMAYSCYLYNYRPHSALNSVAPATCFFGEKDSRRSMKLTHCHPVGCAIHITKPPSKRSKMQSKTIKGWYLGIGINEPGVRVWFPETNEIYTSAHITVWREQRYTPSVVSEALIPVPVDPEKEWEIDCIVDERVQKGKRLFRVRWKGFPDPEDDTWQSYSSLADTIAMEKWESPCEDVIHACVAATGPVFPTVRQALQSREHDKWWDAMCKEHDSIMEQGTWEIVPRPPNRKVVGATWVLRTKKDVQSGHTIYKARLCARGFTQIPGIDFDATFAPTVSRAGLRLTIAIAVQFGMLIHAIDCKNAFLNGSIDREIYLEQPPHFISPGTTSSSHVCRLKKALYGLKQSPLIWNQALHSALESAGFRRMEYEPCLYVHRSRGGDASLGPKTEESINFANVQKDPMFVIIAVYVDDLTIAAMTLKGLDFAKKSISSVFQIKDEGEVKKVIGIEFEKLDNGYILHQREYLNQVLSRYGLNGANRVLIPMDQGCKLYPKAESEPASDSTQYRSQVGAILFAATCTRPDLCVSTNMCARYVENPGQRHSGALKRILRYIKGTLNYGLEFRRNGKPIEITGYCDSDFAGDETDSKSTSGYVVFVNGCAVSWKTTKQKSVSTSTVEAEYIAASMACKEVMWLRWLLEEILEDRLTKPVVWIDNNGARLLAENEQLSEKTKHIRYSHHFIKECIKDGVLELKQVPTQDNVADMMTKPLNRQLLERHRDGIKLVMFKED